MADGVGSAAKFSTPNGMVVKRNGKIVYVADKCNNRIRCVDVITGGVTTIAGSGEEGADDGLGVAAEFSEPEGLALSPEEDKLYIGDCGNRKIRCIDLNDVMRVSTIAGSGEEASRDGVGAEASFCGPGALAISSDGKKLYVADADTIRCIALGDSIQVTTIAGNDIDESVDGMGASTASFHWPKDLALSPCGKKLFVSDHFGDKIRCVDLENNMRVTTIAGTGANGNIDGDGAVATFSRPCGLAASATGDKLFVACPGSLRACPGSLRCISLKGNHTVTTIEDGEEQSRLSQAFRYCAVTPDGNLYATTRYGIVKVTFPRVASPIVVPPSTHKADFRRLMSDPDLIPEGKVAFNVGFPGEAKKMTAAIGRNILFVRSPYFASMFTAGRFKTQDVVDVDDCDYDTFQAMLVYLIEDSVEFTRNDAVLAFELLKLARKHGIVRLAAMCTHHLDEGGKLLTPASVVRLLEGARHHVAEDDGRMFDTYRRYMLDHGSEVVEAGGLEQLQEHAPVTKGLLCDAYAEVKRLREGRGAEGGGSCKRRRVE
jgi:DNA-binding beta-propeller fold protein YncE